MNVDIYFNKTTYRLLITSHDSNTASKEILAVQGEYVQRNGKPENCENV